MEKKSDEKCAYMVPVFSQEYQDFSINYFKQVKIKILEIQILKRGKKHVISN